MRRFLLIAAALTALTAACDGYGDDDDDATRTPTAARTTATPSRSPVPGATLPPQDGATGIPEVDRLLDALRAFETDREPLLSSVGTLDWSCPALAGLPSGPRCEGSLPVFLQVSCDETTYESRADAAAASLRVEIESHAGGEVYAVARAELTENATGYVVASRAPDGRGLLLYVTTDGRVAGYDEGVRTQTGGCLTDVDEMLDARLPDADYLLPPP